MVVLSAAVLEVIVRSQHRLFFLLFSFTSRLCETVLFQPNSHQLKKMDIIYSNANLTINATAGDSGYGLPGINNITRYHQPRVKVRRRISVSSFILPQYEIQKSQFNTRAWTFQFAAGGEPSPMRATGRKRSTRRIGATSVTVIFKKASSHYLPPILGP